MFFGNFILARLRLWPNDVGFICHRPSLQNMQIAQQAPRTAGHQSILELLLTDCIIDSFLVNIHSFVFVVVAGEETVTTVSFPAIYRQLGNEYNMCTQSRYTQIFMQLKCSMVNITDWFLVIAIKAFRSMQKWRHFTVLDLLKTCPTCAVEMLPFDIACLNGAFSAAIL